MNKLDGVSVFREWNEGEIRMLSPLKMAYIGDAVYEVLVRRYLIENNKGSMHQLHKSSTKFVKAESQARFVMNLENELTEDEVNILKRGRNAKSGTIPKNAKVQDYRYSTGFEALIGYLYLSGKEDRIMEFFEKIIGFGDD